MKKFYNFLLELLITMIDEFYILDTKIYLETKFKDFNKVDFTKQNTVVCGFPQAGKSAYTFAIALQYILNDKPVIMVLRNSCRDSIQIKDKARKFAQEHIAHMKSIGYKNCPSLDVVLASEMSCTRTTDQLRNYTNVLNGLTGKYKKLIIVINNGYQLKYTNRIINEYISPEFNNFVMLTDEADNVGYSQIRRDMPKYHAILEYKKLFERAQHIYEISATVFDILLGNNKLTNKGIVIVHPPETYKYISKNITFVPIEIELNSDGLDTFEVDKNIEIVYDELSSLDYYKKDYENNKYNLQADHPIILLHKTSIWHSNHDMFFDDIKYHEVYSTKWTVIVEDSRGFRIYSNELCGETIKILNEKSQDRLEKGEFVFTDKHIDIQDILQFFYDNGGAQRFSHIVIKSGNISGRCRSYISKNGYWHLTHQYYIPSKQVSIPEAVQSCRLVHNRPDNLPLTMYAFQKIIDTIRKGDLMQQEQLDRLLNYEEEIETSQKVKTEFWSKEKIAKGKICHSVLNKTYKPFKVTGCDGGWSTNTYLDNTMIKKLAVPDEPDTEDVENDNDEEYENRLSGEYLIVQKHLLPIGLQKVYDDIVNYIKQNNSKCKWLMRADIINSLSSGEKMNPLRGRMSDMVEEHYIKRSSDYTKNGLIMHKTKTNRWRIIYNEYRVSS